MEITGSVFKRQVRLEAGLARVPGVVADAVADIFVNREQVTVELVGATIDIARHIAAQQKGATRAALADMALGLTTSEAVLSGRQREEAVRPYVEQLRRDYFGATTVPFSSYEKAVAWLRQRAVVSMPSQTLNITKLVRDVTTAMQRFPKDHHLELSIGSHAIPLLAPKPGALKGSVVFDKGSALENLKKVTESMSAGTGCDVALCVAHVLTGTPLLLRPLDWSIEFSVGCGLGRRSATINILQPHAVTLPVLAQAYRMLRKELGLANKKTMAGWHERLLRLVEKRGGVPKRGKTEFWEGIQRKWNKAVPRGGHRYETWMGPLMAYRRLQKALKKR